MNRLHRHIRRAYRARHKPGSSGPHLPIPLPRLPRRILATRITLFSFLNARMEKMERVHARAYARRRTRARASARARTHTHAPMRALDRRLPRLPRICSQDHCVVQLFIVAYRLAIVAVKTPAPRVHLGPDGPAHYQWTLLADIREDGF